MINTFFDWTDFIEANPVYRCLCRNVSQVGLNHSRTGRVGGLEGFLIIHVLFCLNVSIHLHLATPPVVFDMILSSRGRV